MGNVGINISLFNSNKMVYSGKKMEKRVKKRKETKK